YLFGLAGLSMFDLLDFAGIFASWERLSNYLTAAFLGMGVLYSLVLSALCAMWWMGCNLVYLGVSSELDPEATERLIGERLEAAKRKAQQLKAESQRRHDEALEARRRAQEAKANEAGEQEKDESSPAGEEAREVPATAATAATTAKATATCPQCQAPISPGDRFCGTCGQPLS
ncbi:MAG: zinc ribbon domain-containing protein, partial [Zoogloeaceae bacterium]|nr:zinc ribbon domain-containing protein [Zoogloeaceae bacterium]